MDSMHVRLLTKNEAPGVAERVLRSVPEWFGVEESTLGYIKAAGELPTWGAFVDRGRDAAGFLTIKRHFPQSADIHCIAVHKGSHGRGAGSALVAYVERELREQGVRFLQVKTMGPSKPNAEYALTLRFYLRMGFVPLEELHGLWPGVPCMVLVKVL